MTPDPQSLIAEARALLYPPGPIRRDANFEALAENLLEGLEAATRERDEARAALADALEGMEDMRPYVEPYFAEKWGHDKYIARAKAALGEEKSG